MKELFYSFIFIMLFSVILSAQCPQLVWSDEFDGSGVDATKWEFQQGDGCNVNLCNWGNNELQYYQASNATVSDGTLKITAKKESVGGKNYTSTRMRTKNKADFTYGRFEARIKLPTGQGIWPAFWMLSTDEPYGGWPQSGEIDIMELVGSEPEVVHGTIHFGKPWPNNSYSGESYHLHSGIFNDDFHEFALEWEQNELRWYVDGYLYSKKNRGDVSPNRWPFDHDFHLLLNLAVGGNWPGSPNSSTVFPQMMEVDYVRVYDMSRPAIFGERTVRNQASGEIYRVLGAPDGATFNWSVPTGATLVSGQGTGIAVVDWGDTDSSGELKVDITSDCGTDQLMLDVFVEEGYRLDFSFENFDDPSQLEYSFSTGVLREDVANIAPDGWNTSSLIGEYSRNGNELYDILVYHTDAITDASVYLSGERKFYLDVYTSAPLGTLILLQMEDNLRATSDNYPVGRHSRFQAFTSVQNQWERLEFELLDRPDNGVQNHRVNQLVFLFASNSRTNHAYYWDNFDSYKKGSGQTTSIIDPQVAMLPFDVYPNPVNELLYIEPKPEVKLESIRILDQQGRSLRLIKQEDTGGIQKIDVKNLSKGLYYLQVEADGGEVYSVKFMKSSSG